MNLIPDLINCKIGLSQNSRSHIFIFCVFEAVVENDLSYFCIDQDGVKNLVSKMIYSWNLFSLPRQMGFGSVETNFLTIENIKGRQ